ncbi:hypothetical protein K438DRAFT_1858110 [Mycena galopus ATCC 62051]|nr:hypothetical protein K438DRAFT_1858110 [Mycena galopus ATCC 62051]
MSRLPFTYILPILSLELLFLSIVSGIVFVPRLTQPYQLQESILVFQFLGNAHRNQSRFVLRSFHVYFKPFFQLFCLI